MYLKRIEAKGFKSFADKVDLEFGKGVIAIVGPNGSGKSNISDAIRWVLGEQSARTLRGGKMEDIIFAGTQNRKQLGYAKVDITIDNSDSMLSVDYSEITISRRLYRSGESEYLLNNIPCRLKDITEIFMDTGIGKEGYSIIGQGKIEEILSTRSEDRRNLFEEAAGIVKYKWRKEESQKKLENTKINLQRLEDIILELEEQIEPLKEQSEVAKQYLKFRDETKKLEINLVLHNYEINEKKLQEIQNDIFELTKNKDIYEKKKNNLNEEYKFVKNEMINIDEKIKNNNNYRFECEKSYESRCGNLKLLNEKIENLSNEKERLSFEIANHKSKVNTLKYDYGEILKNKNILQNDISIRDKKIKDLDNEYDKTNTIYTETDEKINNNKSEIIQILKDISDFKNKINLFKINLDNLQNRQLQLSKGINTKNDKKDIFYNQIKGLENQIEEAQNKIEEINVHIIKINDNRLLLEQNELSLVKERNKIFDKLKTAEARFQTLNLLQKDMEGFNKSVKNVLKNFKDDKKVYGTISDIITVPKGYETALEIALTSAIQNIVVDNEKTAQEIINFLKTNNLGRATFLPLTTIKPRQINFNINGETEGYLGVASEIVTFNPKFKNAILNLLGRILICDTLDNAIRLARKIDYSCKIVTLDGEVINSGGSFTGGSTNIKNSGIFSRKNEINELIEIIKSNRKYLNEIEEKMQCISKDILQNKNDCENAKKILSNYTIEKEKDKNKLEALLKNIEEIQEYINDDNIEIDQISGKIVSNNSSLEENLNNLKILQEKQMEQEKNFKELQNQYKLVQSKKEDLLNELTDKKINFSEKVKTLEIAEKKLLEINNQSKEYENMLLESNAKIDSCCEAMSEIKNNMKKIEEDIKNELLSIQDFKKVICEFELHKKDLLISYNVMEKNILECEESFNGIIISIHKLDISKTKIEGELLNSANKLWDEYEISIPEAYKYREKIDNMTVASKKLNEIKSNIKDLGNVNVNAIEEYKKVVNKYEFLNNQRDDLIKAQDLLMDIINEITNKMSIQFEESFKVIRENFNTTFKQLFGGGNADLNISGNDVLNAGIDINVQPPGKKLQNLSLLSGGEKGLSAIALIFAILKMKPTPFCVLDEIEAALDDVNVSRFAQFLKAYSNNTQFILITHRKGSMSVADSLYGVTMEEKGISKIISLRLKGGN